MKKVATLFLILGISGFFAYSESASPTCPVGTKLATSSSPDYMKIGSITIAGNEEDCDYVINRDCSAEPFHETDIAWCGSNNLRCALLPGRYRLMERYITCTYRCNNGASYTKRYYQTEVDLVGCCAVWPPIPILPSKDEKKIYHIY